MLSEELTLSCRVRGFRGPLDIASTLYVPELSRGRRVATFLVCLPGGTYTRRYWDLPEIGGEKYSFAEAMCGRDLFVAAIDPLGTGESTRPLDGDAVTFETMASAHVEATAQLVERVVALSGLRRISVIGVGHSLGSALVIHQQAACQDFEGVALLGCPLNSARQAAPEHVMRGGSASTTELRRQLLAELQREDPALWRKTYVHFPRPRQREVAFGRPADAGLVAVDDALQTDLSRAAAIDFVMPGLTSSRAAHIEVPVLLGFGELELPGGAAPEQSLYRASPEVSTEIVEGAGHLHNFALQRARLWERIAGWASTIGARR